MSVNDKGICTCWSQSYLSDQTQIVSVNGASSAPAALKLRCPTGVSAWSYSLFPFTHPISEVASYHSLSHHGFSDDSQLYKYGNFSQLPEIIHSTQSRISDVKAWVTNNQLQ